MSEMIERVARLELPSTAKLATQSGSSRYFTGTACKRGHLAERVTASRACVACCAAISQKSRVNHLHDRLVAEAEQRKRQQPQRLQYARARYAEKRTAIRSATEKWRLKNRHLDAAKTARKKAAKLRATPWWVDHAAIKSVYAEAALMTGATGTPHEVDHIVPLQSDVVCGLHVPWNLRVITKSANSSKKNSLIDEALR